MDDEDQDPTYQPVVPQLDDEEEINNSKEEDDANPEPPSDEIPERSLHWIRSDAFNPLPPAPVFIPRDDGWN